MRFSADVNLVLGLAFCAVGLGAAILQSWLWTFPMAPDPSGVDPNGVTTAPKFWRMVHRGMGYLFLWIYLVLAVQMLSRFWRFESEAWSFGPVLHAIFGLGIGAVLGVKIWILRRGQRYGKLLPYFGWGLVGLAFLTVGLVVKPVTRLQGTDPVSEGSFSFEEAAVMRARVYQNCTQCHGLSVVVGGGDDDWPEILEEMAENAGERGLSDPTAPDRARMAEFLGHLVWVEKDDDGRNRRGRGRDEDDD